MAAIKIKLVVGRSRKHVLLVDASSDFVDVILSLLTLLLSTVQLPAGASSPGCLANLCGSVDRLHHTGLLKVDACHGTLHRPTHMDEFGCTRFGCSACTPFVEKHVTPHRHSQSCRCWEVAMARLMHVYNQTPRKEVFCNWKERFMISDDLVIKQASTCNVASFLSLDGIGNGYEEVDVDVGWAEAVALLQAVINSKTALTDAFKGRFVQEAQQLPPSKRRTGSPPSVEKMQIFVRIFAGETITLDVASSDTVATVRSKVQARRKLTGSCGLVYGGKCLQDPWTLADCGIHREATIHAEFFNRGLQQEGDGGELRSGAEMVRAYTMQLMKMCEESTQKITGE
ncbi:hypothetical protein D1007_44122 [Hordeum vulgare]|nr:hypothetical protein D1007_44122 [Hordeum vulgare]